MANAALRPAEAEAEQDPAGEGATRRRSVRRTVFVACALGIVIGVFIARCVAAARYQSITSDESTHLVHCLSYWSSGNDLGMWELGTPRFPHAVASLASYQALKNARLIPRVPNEANLTKLVLSGAQRVTLPARCVAIAWGAALLVLVFWSAARDRGARAGLVAAGLLSLLPEMLAHSSIAGSDVPFTAAAFLSVVLLARYYERPGVGRWLCAALAVGLAWATRHSAILLLPLAFTVHAAASWRNRSRLERGAMSLVETILASAQATAALAIVAFAILWAGDGFRALPLSEVTSRFSAGSDQSGLVPIDLSSLPIPTSALSLIKQVRHQNQGHEAYFCGAVRQQGWPLYFPVAFLLKTPLGFIGLLVLCAAFARPRSAFDWIALGTLGILWVMLLRNHVNIGLRYALLTYPLAVGFAARLFEKPALRDRVRGTPAIACVLWLMAASFSAGVNCLSYFNEIAGGARNGWLYLADSNIDWGQDFHAMLPELRKLGIHEVTIDVSSERRLDAPDVFAIPNPSKIAQVPAVTATARRLYDSEGGSIPIYTRYVAVSVSRLLGLYSQNDMTWLWTRKLLRRVGDSILLFDLDQPASEPFVP